jgi:2-methylisocitrate lyase-like PEP mutase family enzyme
LAIKVEVVGINQEDSTQIAEPVVMDIQYQADLLRAVPAQAEADGVPLVINAQIDIYLREVMAISGRYDQVIEQDAAYFEAGADCIYPIGLADGVKIVRLVQQVNGPFNILAGAGTPTIGELEAMRVQRV